MRNEKCFLFVVFLLVTFLKKREKATVFERRKIFKYFLNRKDCLERKTDLKFFVIFYLWKLELDKKSNKSFFVVFKEDKNHVLIDIQKKNPFLFKGIHKKYRKEVNTKDSICQKRKKEIKNDIKIFNFNPKKYNKKEIVFIIQKLLSSILFKKIFKGKKFKIFLYSIYQNYENVPYHSIKHIADVLQFFCFLYKNHKEIRNILTERDVLIFVVAILCHDIGHPGKISCIKKNSFLDFIFQESIPEFYHSIIAQSLLSSYSWPQNIQTKNKCFNEKVLFLIQQTNLCFNLDYILKIEERFLEIEEHPLGYKKEDKKLVLGSLMKFCDLGNVLRPEEISSDWDYFIRKENDKNYKDFIETIAEPFYYSLLKLFPSLSVYSSFIENNKKR